jgi:hypothetical protein
MWAGEVGEEGGGGWNLGLTLYRSLSFQKVPVVFRKSEIWLALP